jgi:hypothetical protein
MCTMCHVRLMHRVLQKVSARGRTTGLAHFGLLGQIETVSIYQK